MHQAKSQFITGKPVRIPKALRAEVEAAIQAHLTAVEKLTAVLDRADGDANLEPSIGAAGAGWAHEDQRDWAYSNTDDAEGDEHDGREPDVDDEPSLAHTNAVDQRHACQNPDLWPFTIDAEGEHDGREEEGRSAGFGAGAG